MSERFSEEVVSRDSGESRGLSTLLRLGRVYRAEKGDRDIFEVKGTFILIGPVLDLKMPNQTRKVSIEARQGA